MVSPVSRLSFLYLSSCNTLHCCRLNNSTKSAFLFFIFYCTENSYSLIFMTNCSQVVETDLCKLYMLKHFSFEQKTMTQQHKHIRLQWFWLFENKMDPPPRLKMDVKCDSKTHVFCCFAAISSVFVFKVGEITNTYMQIKKIV